MKKLRRALIHILLLSLCGYGTFVYLFEKYPRHVFPVKSYTVNVYFMNSKLDPQHTVCDYVYGLPRTLSATPESLPRLLLEELLEGPTPEERARGYESAIPAHMPISFFSITADAVELVLDYDNRQLTSCMNTMLKTQIETTLHQLTIPETIKLNPDYLIDVIYIRENGQRAF